MFLKPFVSIFIAECFHQSFHELVSTRISLLHIRDSGKAVCDITASATCDFYLCQHFLCPFKDCYFACRISLLRCDSSHESSCTTTNDSYFHTLKITNFNSKLQLPALCWRDIVLRISMVFMYLHDIEQSHCCMQIYKMFIE